LILGKGKVLRPPEQSELGQCRHAPQLLQIGTPPSLLKRNLAQMDLKGSVWYKKKDNEFLSSYNQVYSVIYDSGSVPRRAIFSPRETSPELCRPQLEGGRNWSTLRQVLSLSQNRAGQRFAVESREALPHSAVCRKVGRNNAEWVKWTKRVKWQNL